MGCGVVCECRYGSWFDRHPAATVALSALVGLPGGIFLLAAMVGSPLFAIATIATGTLAACGLFADREHKRRMALRARAEYQNWLLNYRG